jgi:hypothetical protein
MMRIAIIAEGAEDQAVISNILRAFGVDKSNILCFKPYLGQDANSAGFPDNPTIGTFKGVKNACVGYEGRRHYFERAFGIAGVDFVVVHLDTAEIENHETNFQKPTKVNNPSYCTELRSSMIKLINDWLGSQYENQILYAIAIEEIEAWCLTIFEKTDSTQSANPKGKLNLLINKMNMKYDFEEISKDFRKQKKLATYLPYNQSLADFVNSIATTL